MRGPQLLEGRRRFPLFVVLCAVVFAALYAVVVFLYAQGGRSDEGALADASAPGLHAVLTPRDVDAAADRIRFDLAFAPGHDLISDDGMTVLTGMDVMLTSAAGRQSLHYEAGATAAPQAVELRTSGTIEQWPFDAHPSATMILVSAADGDGKRAVPADLGLAAHHVPGWSISIREDPSAASMTVEGGIVVKQYVIEAKRATATVAFGLVLLGLMVVMPILGLTAAVLALRGRRRIEIGFFTWNAGMLFATPTLRNFLPGQPPIGSWVDYLVVLWVIAGLILALLISVVAWYRWGRPQREIPGAGERADDAAATEGHRPG